MEAPSAELNPGLKNQHVTTLSQMQMCLTSDVNDQHADVFELTTNTVESNDCYLKCIGWHFDSEWKMWRTGVCSIAHRSNRPDHCDSLMLDRSAVGQLSSLNSRTKWQRLPAEDTLHSVLPAGNRCHFVLLDKDESCPTAVLSGHPSVRLFDR